MVKKAVQEAGRTKTLAWMKGEAEGVFSTFFNLNPQINVEYGPIGKDRHARDFEHIVKTLLHNPNSVTIQRDGDRIQLFIGNKEYDLSKTISGLDPRVLMFNDDDFESYVNFAKSDESSQHAMFEDEEQLIALGRNITDSIENPSEDEFRALDQGNNFTSLHYAELIAVNIYTQHYYETMNALMRGSSHPFEDELVNDDQYEKDMKELLIHIGLSSSGLSKTPVVEIKGKAYRYDDELLPDFVYNARIASANSPNENKTVVREQGFVSSSLDKPSKNFDGPHRTVFKGLIGCYIGPISFYPEERELLMPPTDIVYEAHKEEGENHYYLARPVYTPRLMSERELKVLHEKTKLQLFDDMQSAAKAEPDGILINETQVVLLLTQLESIRSQMSLLKNKSIKSKVFSNKKLHDFIEIALVRIMTVDMDKNLEPAEKLALMSSMVSELSNFIKENEAKSTKQKILKKVAPKLYKKVNPFEALKAQADMAQLQINKKLPAPQTHPAKPKPAHSKPMLHKQHGGKLQVPKQEEASFLASNIMQDAISHVFNEYLNQTYSDDVEPISGLTYRDLYDDDWELDADGTIIPRPNHNIAHTLRGVYMLDAVIEAYKQAEPKGEPVDRDLILEVANNPLEVQRMQITLLFSVVGRLNDMGFADNPDVFAFFRERSVMAFKSYVSEHCPELFPGDKFEDYAEYLRDFGNPTNDDPQCILMRQCHRADLPRCYEEDEFGQKVMEGADWDDHSYYGDFGENIAEDLLAYSLELIKATGDRNLFDDGHDYDDALFKKCNTDPQKCQQALENVDKFKPKQSQAYKA